MLEMTNKEFKEYLIEEIKECRKVLSDMEDFYRTYQGREIKDPDMAVRIMNMNTKTLNLMVCKNTLEKKLLDDFGICLM